MLEATQATAREIPLPQQLLNKSISTVLRLPAVWSRAPAAVRVRHQPAAQHEFLVLLHEQPVIEYHADVVRVEAFRALGTADVDPALRYLDAQVLAKAVGAGAVVARHDVGKTVSCVAQQAQRALQKLRGGG